VMDLEMLPMKVGPRVVTVNGLLKKF